MSAVSALTALLSVPQPREKGRMRFHKLQNVQIALNYLKHRQVRMGWDPGVPPGLCHAGPSLIRSVLCRR